MVRITSLLLVSTALAGNAPRALFEPGTHVLDTSSVHTNISGIKCAARVGQNGPNFLTLTFEFAWQEGKEPPGFRHGNIREVPSRQNLDFLVIYNKYDGWPTNLWSKPNEVLYIIPPGKAFAGEHRLTGLSISAGKTNEFDICAFSIPELPGVTRSPLSPSNEVASTNSAPPAAVTPQAGH